MVLEKNENYYNADSIQTDVINYQIIADTQQAVMSYENGDIDFVKLTGDLVNQYRNEEGFSTQIGGYIWHLVPNCENEFLSNANLRRAISSAIDRDTMVNSILNDGSVVATGYVLQDFGKARTASISVRRRLPTPLRTRKKLWSIGNLPRRNLARMR